ncbi:MAG TPA: hypothetical protein VFA41_09555 [Ktedonobacteraceae bacterium]|jgi:plastocyanin|nr:hypothetical protein [Ktedonobacteraceae bacterium]
MSNKGLRFFGILLALLAIGSVLLVACARPGEETGNSGNATPTSGSGGGGGGGCASGTVHMDAANFLSNCVNIAKGAKVTLVDDVQVLHIITNGSWVNGTAQQTKEPGAPTISNVNISGGSTTIGPFNTAGTFHVLCIVHVNMNLTVNVH